MNSELQKQIDVANLAGLVSVGLSQIDKQMQNQSANGPAAQINPRSFIQNAPGYPQQRAQQPMQIPGLEKAFIEQPKNRPLPSVDVSSYGQLPDMPVQAIPQIPMLPPNATDEQLLQMEANNFFPAQQSPVTTLPHSPPPVVSPIPSAPQSTNPNLPQVLTVLPTTGDGSFKAMMSEILEKINEIKLKVDEMYADFQESKKKPVKKRITKRSKPSTKTPSLSG